MIGRTLSKSRLMAGLQCPLRLWWTVQEPEAPELQPDAGLQARFRRGHRVGEAAQRHFAGGELVELDPRNRRAAVERTREE